MKTITIEHEVNSWRLESLVDGTGDSCILTIYYESSLCEEETTFTFKTFDEAVNYVRNNLL